MAAKKVVTCSLPTIGKDALDAIVKGIEENHPTCNLEKLGLSQRLLNMLEKQGFTTLESLMSTKKEKLIKCKNFGQKQLCLLFEALSKYDELDLEDEEDEEL